MLALQRVENVDNNNINDMDDRCNSYFLGISTCEIVWLDYFASPLKERHEISDLWIFLKIGR